MLGRARSGAPTHPRRLPCRGSDVHSASALSWLPSVGGAVLFRPGLLSCTAPDGGQPRDVLCASSSAGVCVCVEGGSYTPLSHHHHHHHQSDPPPPFLMSTVSLLCCICCKLHFHITPPHLQHMASGLCNNCCWPHEQSRGDPPHLPPLVLQTNT